MGGVPTTPWSSPAVLLAEAVTFLPDPELSNPHRKRTPPAEAQCILRADGGEGGCQAGSPARPLGTSVHGHWCVSRLNPLPTRLSVPRISSPLVPEDQACPGGTR